MVVYVFVENDLGDQIEIINISDIDIDLDVFLYSPILYGRNIRVCTRRIYYV